ncbi:ketoacyl-ACP synthase III family protein [Nocardia iowensis]|uniref:Ketoacyl-ACP synthase III family protein n=1 Tax=Nocardia iowensis TaxID=204891 RepID=A0ABX8RYL5_NOCIO|nr:ketoacyl-ACP synthase III family protein [Nocardia iowensis]QXN94376.1 ketoacyl-ACP synthase III family protein [Nocardia iowensis]
MRTPNTYIAALGSFLPATVTAEQAVAQGLYPAETAEIHELGGAAVAGPIPAPEMALRAAEIAVKRSGLVAEEFDLLLYASTWLQGPEGWLPHPYLQRHLVGPIPALEIRQGCNGMFSALSMAVEYLRADPDRHSALLVAADNFGTPLMDRWKMSALFIAGDAASAVVLTKTDGFAQLLSVCHTSIPEAEEIHRASEPLFPPGVSLGKSPDFFARLQEITAKVAAAPDSPLGAAMARVREEIPVVVGQALDEAGIGLDDIARVAFLNCSREATEQRCMVPLGLPMEKSTWDFGRMVGHCSASDQILSFEHLVTTGQLRAGQYLLLFGSAPGVLLSAAVIKVLRDPEWTE